MVQVDEKFYLTIRSFHFNCFQILMLYQKTKDQVSYLRSEKQV